MANDDVIALERKIYAMTLELNKLKQQTDRVEVPNYTFKTLDGEVTLDDLFAGKDKLLMIHNMGQGCRYCTLWGDGLSPLLPHLESVVSVAMVSKDEPELQRRFASSRGWRFRMASHGGGDYIKEQSAVSGQDNYPGVVGYEREGGQIYRINSSPFGPGDLYCPVWNLLSTVGVDGDTFTPQFNYWLRPDTLDDGGENLVG